MNQSHERSDGPPSGPNWSRINQWVLWIGLAGAVGWLFIRHNAHLLQLLPFLILLACPLLHVFGHGSHGGQSDHGDDVDTKQPPTGGRGRHQR